MTARAIVTPEVTLASEAQLELPLVAPGAAKAKRVSKAKQKAPAPPPQAPVPKVVTPAEKAAPTAAEQAAATRKAEIAEAMKKPAAELEPAPVVAKVPAPKATKAKKVSKAKEAAKPVAKLTGKPQEKREAPPAPTEAKKKGARPEPSELVKKGEAAVEAKPKPVSDLDEKERELTSAVAAAVRHHYEEAKDVAYDPADTGFAATNVDVVARIIRKARGTYNLTEDTRDAIVRRLAKVGVTGVARVMDARKAQAVETAKQQDIRALELARERKAADEARKEEIRKGKVSQQQTRRGKLTEESAAEMEARHPITIIKQAMREHKRPEALQDKRLLAIAEQTMQLREKRKTEPKYAGTQEKAEIERLKKERVEARRAEEAETKAKQEAEHKEQVRKIAERKPEEVQVEEPTTVEGKLKRKQDEVVAQERKAKISEVLSHEPMLSSTIIDRNPSNWQDKVMAYIRRLVEKSPEVGENIVRGRSMEEALITAGKKFTSGAWGKSQVYDFEMGRVLLNAARKGDTAAEAEFWQLFGNRRVAGEQTRADIENLPGEETETAAEGDLMAKSRSLAAPQRPARSVGETVELKSGVTIDVRSKGSARNKLGELLRDGSPRGLQGVLTKLHARQLNKLVGDVTTMVVDASRLNSIGVVYGESAGAEAMFSYIKDPSYANGWRPVVMLSEDLANATPEYQTYVMMHEMTHAATSRAIVTNYNGVRDVLNTMLDVLRAEHFRQFGAAPDRPYGFTNAQEMVAEAYTNREFRQFLRNTPIDPGNRKKLDALLRATPIRSWWDYFVRATELAIGKIVPMRSRDNFMGSIIALERLTTRSAPRRRRWISSRATHSSPYRPTRSMPRQ